MAFVFLTYSQYFMSALRCPCLHCVTNQALMNSPNDIRNKIKRREIVAKIKATKTAEKKKEKLKRKRDEEAGVVSDRPVQRQKTLDNTREKDDTVVKHDDEEILADEAEDEFAQYFKSDKTPKVMITTRPRPSKELFEFMKALVDLIPNCFYYKRDIDAHRSYPLKKMCEYAAEKDFTHLIAVNSKSKMVNALYISHLPNGPTAHFKVSSFIPSTRIKNAASLTDHTPEIILNQFTTRLGHRVGRFLGSLFPHSPEFQGRRVVTLHNQRDFIFVRQHRYIFDDAETSRLQEIGPQFTLKMRSLQRGTFDTEHGEYEWLHKHKEMDTSRRRFFL